MSTEEVYMRDPPAGEDRFAAGTMIPSIIAVTTTTLILATIVYGLRLFTRIHVLRSKVRIDDCLAGGSMVLGWGYYGILFPMMYQGGTGTNFWQVTQEQYQTLLIWTVPCTFTYVLSCLLAKLSLLFFYRSLSPEKGFRIAVTVLICLFSAYGVCWICIQLFGCQPIDGSWNLQTMPTAKCVDKPRFYMSASIANVTMDVVVLLVPLWIVVPLKMPWRQKVSLILLFATGGFVIIAGAQNIVLTNKIFTSGNYTWDLGTEFSWVSAEIAASIICASAGSLKPLFSRYLPFIMGSASRTYANSGSNQYPNSRSQATWRNKNSRPIVEDAYELDSNDDTESKKDDEATLWNGGAFRRDVTITGNRPVRTTGDKPLGNVPASQRPRVDSTSGKGINVTQDISVSYKSS